MNTTSNLRPHRFTSWLLGFLVGLTTLAAGTSVSAIGVAPAILDFKTSAGRVVERTITLVNNERSTRTFTFKKENFSPSSEPGVAIFDGGAQDAFPSWVSLSPDAVTLAPGETASVHVSVAVPVGAVPGDYYGVVFAGSRAEQVSAATALLLFLTVEGEADYGIELVSLDLDLGSRSWLLGEAQLRVQNSGTVYIKPEGRVMIDPLIGRALSVASNPEDLRVLPNQTRSWKVAWGSDDTSGFLTSWVQELRWFALGPVTVRAEVMATDDVSDRLKQRVWVWPWRSGVLLLGALMLYTIFRRYMKYRQH